jgi:hypothetical protein
MQLAMNSRRAPVMRVGRAIVERVSVEAAFARRRYRSVTVRPRARPSSGLATVADVVDRYSAEFVDRLRLVLTRKYG